MPTFKRPVAGTTTSGYGMRGGVLHAGMDIAAPTGTPVGATLEGTVSAAGWNGGYGNAVDITHAGGYMTRYAHMSKISVTKGQTVATGSMVGKVGSTGDSTGPHLHFEIRINGKAVNPAPYLSGKATIIPAGDMTPIGLTDTSAMLKRMGVAASWLMDTHNWARVFTMVGGLILVFVSLLILSGKMGVIKKVAKNV